MRKHCWTLFETWRRRRFKTDQLLMMFYIYSVRQKKNEFNNFAHTLIEQCQHDVENCDKSYQKCLNTLPEQKSLGGSVDKLHTHGKRYARRNAEM